MAQFYTYETVDIPLMFQPKGVLVDYRHIIVSLRQNSTDVQINKDENDLDIDVENDKITISLTQEETAMFDGGDEKNPGVVRIQVNIYYENTERDVSAVKIIKVHNNLYKKVINYE